MSHYLSLSYCVFNLSKANIIDQSSLSISDHSRIEGGGPVEKGSWPFIVRLKFGRALCGGSLIDGEAVITAAHCCDEADDYTDVTVFINDHHYGLGLKQKHV